MSLAGNPLAEFGFGFTETTQNWTTIINYIKKRVGVVGQFEFSDEAIVAEIKEQIMPLYSIYDGYPQYDVLTSADVISENPSRIYSLNRVKQIISVRDIIKNEYLYLGNLGEDTLKGYGGTSIEDFLLSRNYNDMNKLILPVDTWKFVPPARLEIIDLAGLYQVYDMVIAYNTVHPDPSSINPTLFDKFKDLCAGYFMLVIGNIRARVGSISTPTGTVELNGDALKQEGDTLLREVKEKLITTPPDQLIYMW